MGGSGRKQIRHGRDRALKELERFYEGPIRGLQIAPEFYGLLESDKLRNTPLGRSLQLQQQLLGEVSAGLGGKGFGERQGKGAGRLPPDLANAIGENLMTNLARAGVEGSPAAALQASMRFTGASEAIRSQRIAQAQSVLGQVGGASILPSASEFLALGARRASEAAGIQYGSGQQLAQIGQQERQMYGQLAGMAASGALGFGAAPAGFGMAGLLGGISGRSIGSIDPSIYQKYPSYGYAGLTGGQ